MWFDPRDFFWFHAKRIGLNLLGWALLVTVIAIFMRAGG